MGLVGIDEVGRGCWAGPLVVGAVILRAPVPGLNDSKKLSKAKREALDIEIRQHAYVGLGWVPAPEIDELGLTKATSLACQRALLDLGHEYDAVVIDGNINYLPDDPKATCLIGADALVAEVSAASIVAKVARDNYMAQQARIFPEYGFEKHVGYGTAVHRSAIKSHGITALHRKSFRPVKELL